MSDNPRPGRTRARSLAVAAALAAAVIGGALYGTLSPSGNRACAGDAALGSRLDAASRGEVAAFAPLPRATALPALAFVGPDGGPTGLDAFKGRTVLLNLWATWCEPCKREMPALDRLQAELGSPRFEVVAVNIDTRDAERARTWLAGAGVTRLAFYSDPQARIFQDLRRAGLAEGMPTTLLVDPAGCQLGRISGPAEWASPDGLALIRAALAR